MKKYFKIRITSLLTSIILNSCNDVKCPDEINNGFFDIDDLKNNIVKINFYQNKDSALLKISDIGYKFFIETKSNYKGLYEINNLMILPLNLSGSNTKILLVGTNRFDSITFYNYKPRTVLSDNQCGFQIDIDQPEVISSFRVEFMGFEEVENVLYLSAYL